VSCPDADAIQCVLQRDGSATPAERAEVLAHAEGCDSCRALLGELVRQATPEPEPEPEPEDERAPPSRRDKMDAAP
ncbi:MAG TPA: zf-HC2 domain-containing protein, partial [Haliangiales bacterium]|nr:zf-HC2 domain-containing protein [Haliangiales bacterium]